MRKLIFLPVILFIALIYGCSDNLFESNSDKKDGNSKDSSMEIALNNKEYQKIIDTLGSKSLNSLSDREQYILQMGYMGRAGFDILPNLDTVFDNDKADLNVIFNVQNDFKDLNLKVSDYNSVIRICSDTSYKSDKDMLLACGLASSMKVMTSVGATFDKLPPVSDTCKLDDFKGCTQSDIELIADKIDNDPLYVDIKDVILNVTSPNSDDITMIEKTIESITGKKQDKNVVDTLKEVEALFKNYGSGNCSTKDLLFFIQGNKTDCING